MFKKITVIAVALAALVSLTGCYEQVPAGNKGKVLGVNGFQPEMYPPSKVWLNNNVWNVNHEKLYLVETTTQMFVERLTVKLDDDLDITTSISFRGRIRNNNKVLNNMFNDIKMASGDFTVTTKEAYDIYVRQVVRTTARDILATYNIGNINKNRKRIAVEIYKELVIKLEALPIEVSEVTLGNIPFPDVIVEGINTAKRKDIDIKKQEADTLVELARYTGLEKIADKEYNIKMKEAKRIADYNSKISNGITKDLLRLRELEVQQTIADNLKGNKNVIYMPLPMMGQTSNMRVLK